MPPLTEMSAFVVHALDVLRAKAGACVRGNQSERIDFMANLFAVCTHLQEVKSSADLRGVVPLDPRRSVDAWDDVPQALEQVATGQPVLAYQALMALLLSLEQQFPWTFADGEKPPQWAIDVSIPGGEHADARGTVYCWIRPLSDLRRLVQTRGGPAHYHYRPIDQLRCLGMFWDRGLVPRLRPMPWLGRLAPVLIEQSGRRLGRGDFRVALCPLDGPFWPRFTLRDGVRQFAIDAGAPMHAPEQLEAHLDELLAQARTHEIDILVFPELTIDAQALTWLQQRLGREAFPHAVIAGSFHVADGDTLRNRAPVLDQDGRALWSHDKRGHFRVMGRELRAMSRAATASGTPSLFYGTLPAEHDADEEYLEGIDHGDTLHVFDAPLGRVAVLICADALDSSHGFRSLVEAASIDLLLIIGMSPKTADFVRWAEELRRQQTAVLFVNTGCLLQRRQHRDDPEAVAAFMSLPWREQHHPVRARWRHGDSRVEVMDGKAGEQWTPTEVGADALTLLPGGQGLIVNLGAWWGETFPLRAMYSGRKV